VEASPPAGGGLPAGGRDEVDLLAEEFLARRRKGENPTIEEYQERRPDLRAEISDVFPALLLVEELRQSSPGALAAGAAGGALPSPAALPGAPGGEEGLRQVGEYRIRREIGRGGMGIVYEAEQESLGRRVALKVLPFHSLLDRKRLERFHEEARAAARLSHPHIVPVFGVGEHLGLHYFVMQYIPGHGLDRIIEDVRRLREEGSSSSTLGIAGDLSCSGRGGRERYRQNVARLARDAALALQHAHSQGILHRDVKPSNLLLDPTGHVWLADFGLAKSEGDDDLTQSGDVPGTVRYMAPERFKGWSDPRSDVYSLGLTLYELLALRPAFLERDRARLIRKVTTEDPPPLRKIDRTIGRDLETIVLKAIAKEPGQRYPSAGAMAGDLDRYLLGVPVEARRSTPLSLAARWCRRNPLPAALLGLVAILLVAGMAISSSNAVRLSREHSAGQEKLRAAYLAEAGALRASARPGRRFEALEALRKAAAIRPGADLVDAALASFSLVDLRPVKSWSKDREVRIEPSPDGSVMAIALKSGEIVLRSAADDHELLHLPGPGYDVAYCGLRFSPGGRHLAARYLHGRECELRVWGLDRRAALVQVKDAQSGDALAFSPDSRWVALITSEGSLRLYDLAAGSLMEEVGAGLDIERIAIHPGCRLIAMVAGHPRKRICIYDRDGGQVIRRLSTTDQAAFEQVAWNPDGRTLAAASPDHTVYVWNVESGELTRTLQGHWAEAVGVEFDPQGYLMVSWAWDPAVRLWEPGSDRPVISIFRKEGWFANNAKSFWTGNDYQVDRWDLEPGLPVFTLFGHEGKAVKHPETIALAPGGQLAATGGKDGVRLWDLSRRREVGHLPTGEVHSVIFDARGTLYASGAHGIWRWAVRPAGGAGGRIAMGRAQRLTPLERWGRAALSGAGTKIAVNHRKDHAHVIDLTAPEREVHLRGLPPDWTITLSPDGLWAAAGSWGSAQSEEAWVWDLRDWKTGVEAKPARRLPARRAEVKFDPTGRHLATGTPGDCTLWRAADWQPVWRIERPRGLTFPAKIAFDREGKIAAVSYNDSRIWLLEAGTGRKLHELEAAEPVMLTELALEGGRLAASTIGHRIHVWDLNGLAREVAALGLEWEVAPGGTALADLAPVRVAVEEESADLLLDESGDLSPRELFRPASRLAFALELVSFGQIDQALAAPKFLIGEGERWRYFPGQAEPSPGLEWTAQDHDDRQWKAGRSPLTGWVLPPGSEGTHLATQPGSYTTLYLRRSFDVADPGAVARFILAAELEDGFVVYLNGQEVGRVNAGDPGERLSFQALASRDRRRQTEVLEASPSLLRRGRNVLAIQVLSMGGESRMHLLPVLAAVPVPAAERDRGRTARLAAGGDGAPDAALLAYREGRVLQRAGRIAEALEQLERAGELDRGAVEPVLRRMACHRALGQPARAESLARGAIEAGEVLDDDRLWRAWTHTVVAGLRRSPAEALASLPHDPRPPPARAAGDHRWILEELSRDGVIRINCGGGDVETSDGKRWSRDRFFLGGFSNDRRPGGECRGANPGEGDEALNSTERRFAGNESFYRAYSIPLPPGRYRVLLHLDGWTTDRLGIRLYDVLLEGRSVAEGGETLRTLPETSNRLEMELDLADGALDIDFLPHRYNAGVVSAIEVERVAR
jgi:serine/threonine protein kinase/WD40 repeat protein